MTPAELVARLRQERRPFRFLCSRFLWKTGLCRLLSIERRGYRLIFSPSAIAATLWVDRLAGCFEEDLLARFLQQGDLFVDVGANIGYLSLAGAVRVGREGRVIAFEPHPRICKILRANIALNGFSQVEVVQCALGQTAGRVSFADRRSDDQNCIVDNGGIDVPLARLDQVLADTGQEIALLKIDVEGYEKFVLDGMGELLRRTRVIIFESFEKHYARQGYTLDEVVALLRMEGFTVGKIGPEGGFVPIPAGYRSSACENLVALNTSCGYNAELRKPC